jgi:hypothetical protein
MAEFNRQNKDVEAENGAFTSFLPAVLMISLAAVAGSLWLSIGMGLKACPLCFYQRSFAMGVSAVLVMGLSTKCSHRILVTLAMPMAVAALGVAMFHVYLEFTGKLECPAGIFSVGTAPQQSLAILSFLVIAMLGHGLSDLRNGSSIFALVGSSIMGGLIAWGSIASAPPLPKAPTKAYEAPFDTCRPPIQALVTPSKH